MTVSQFTLIDAIMLVHLTMLSAAVMVASAVPVDVRMPHNDPSGSWLSCKLIYAPHCPLHM